MYWSVDRAAVGARAEAAAARALEARGYRIISRNTRSRLGELDLICRDGDAYVFCEVKSRGSSAFGDAAEALTPVKLARLGRLAPAYLARVGRRAEPWRIELVAVRLDENGEAREVEVIPVV
jgi:putative endonuclease